MRISLNMQAGPDTIYLLKWRLSLESSSELKRCAGDTPQIQQVWYHEDPNNVHLSFDARMLSKFHFCCQHSQQGNLSGRGSQELQVCSWSPWIFIQLCWVAPWWPPDIGRMSKFSGHDIQSSRTVITNITCRHGCAANARQLYFPPLRTLDGCLFDFRDAQGWMTRGMI